MWLFSIFLHNTRLNRPMQDVRSIQPGGPFFLISIWWNLHDSCISQGPNLYSHRKCHKQGMRGTGRWCKISHWLPFIFNIKIRLFLIWIESSISIKIYDVSDIHFLLYACSKDCNIFILLHQKIPHMIYARKLFFINLPSRLVYDWSFSYFKYLQDRAWRKIQNENFYADQENLIIRQSNSQIAWSWSYRRLQRRKKFF